MRKQPAKVQELVLAELAIAPILKELASIAVKFGITPKDLHDNLKRESVHAAARHAMLRNGRINHSHIAVITGLSRGEVRRLMDLGAGSDAVASGSRHRAWRLISAWHSDPHFLGTSSNPRPLRLYRGRRSFNNLVAKYCGDVPTMAVISELQRIGAIEVSGDLIALRKDAGRKLRRDIQRAQQLIKITSRVLQSAADDRRGQRMLVRSATLRVTNLAEQAVVLQRVDSTLTAAMRAIQALGRFPVARGLARKQSRAATLEVYALVSSRSSILRERDRAQVAEKTTRGTQS